MDDYGRQRRIHERRANGVLETADEHRLVDKWIERPAKAPPFLSESGPARGRRTRDYQNFEIGAICIRASKSRRQHIRAHPISVLVRVPVAGILAEGPRQ